MKRASVKKKFEHTFPVWDDRDRAVSEQPFQDGPPNLPTAEASSEHDLQALASKPERL